MGENHSSSVQELIKDKEPFRSACKKPYLAIKCKDPKKCDCSPKKKSHFRKSRFPFPSRKRHTKQFRFFRKRQSHSKRFPDRKKSRCFICKKKGHFTKDCPVKPHKAIKLIQHLESTTEFSPTTDQVEHLFSEQEEPNDDTVFALPVESSDSDSSDFEPIYTVQPSSILIHDRTIPIPSVKIQIIPSKYHKPITAIGFLDTGAQRSMLDPAILPTEYWKTQEEHFKAADGKIFTTKLVTKHPIGIQLFPNCVVWIKLIGSSLPNKDLLLGFDILHQAKNVQITSSGLRYKSMIKPFTSTLKIYSLANSPPSYQAITDQILNFCPENHGLFTHLNPLWKNPKFFISLPFKLNEDSNPTKATHTGMTPQDLILAQQECAQLLKQGLIEPTNSQWACQAFYVEKMSEILRGKK
ncbi:hypothetical protein WN944_023922 [Citrus x changshan-huyou]|uniref:CCHC-type domain-containing protein n=1 Tax=Citrus x changshan-huyou TaxID=2935761 RepID=A0AAP0QF83_9ROSI